jgi:hypothetical protein
MKRIFLVASVIGYELTPALIGFLSGDLIGALAQHRAVRWWDVALACATMVTVGFRANGEYVHWTRRLKRLGVLIIQ